MKRNFIFVTLKNCMFVMYRNVVYVPWEVVVKCFGESFLFI